MTIGGSHESRPHLPAYFSSLAPAASVAHRRSRVLVVRISLGCTFRPGRCFRVSPSTGVGRGGRHRGNDAHPCGPIPKDASS